MLATLQVSHNCHVAEPGELLAELAISCNRAHAGLTTNGKFANHNGEADQYRKNEVNEQEGEAAAHTHLVREAPNVAQTDCRTDSCHQETKVGAKRSAIVFHNFLSFIFLYRKLHAVQNRRYVNFSLTTRQIYKQTLHYIHTFFNTFLLFKY